MCSATVNEREKTKRRGGETGKAGRDRSNELSLEF
jgi:hypothetical protein